MFTWKLEQQINGLRVWLSKKKVFDSFECLKGGFEYPNLFRGCLLSVNDKRTYAQRAEICERKLLMLADALLRN